MRQIALLLLSVLLFCQPITALLPPVDNPKIAICNDVNFFFWNDSSDAGAPYNKFATYPQLQDGAIFSTTVSSTTGERTIGDFITEPFPAEKTLFPGLTRYRVYLNVSSAVGATTYNFIPYNVSVDGTETRMFFDTPQTVDIDNIATPTEYLVSYARRNYTEFLPGERLLIRVNASTTSTVARTAYLNVAGTQYASMAQIGYWDCAEPTPTLTPTPIPNLPAPPTVPPEIPWYNWILLGLFVAYLLGRLIP
jgi:hypothetical protein